MSYIVFILTKLDQNWLAEEEDSNPRNAQTLNGFQDRRFQPLSHLSEPNF